MRSQGKVKGCFCKKIPQPPQHSTFLLFLHQLQHCVSTVFDSVVACKGIISSPSCQGTVFWLGTLRLGMSTASWGEVACASISTSKYQVFTKAPKKRASGGRAFIQNSGQVGWETAPCKVMVIYCVGCDMMATIHFMEICSLYKSPLLSLSICSWTSFCCRLQRCTKMGLVPFYVLFYLLRALYLYLNKALFCIITRVLVAALWNVSCYDYVKVLESVTYLCPWKGNQNPLLRSSFPGLDLLQSLCVLLT